MYNDDTRSLRPEPVLGPAVLSATTSATIDTTPSGSNALLISVGVGGITFSGTNKIVITLSHSDDGTTFAPVGANDVKLRSGADASVNAGGVVSLVAAHASPTVAIVGYIGAKPFLKVEATFSGTHGTGTPIAVTLLRSHVALDGSPKLPA